MISMVVNKKINNRFSFFQKILCTR